MSKSFTLIELLIVIGIIVLFNSLLLPNYGSGVKQLALERSAHKLAQDLRRAQEMAMSSKEISGFVPNGIGIHFYLDWSDYYILFADINGNNKRDAGIDQDLETIILEPGVKIYSMSVSSVSSVNFSILFQPPDPTVWINEQPADSAAQIILSLSNDPTSAKTVSVNNAGLIEVGN